MQKLNLTHTCVSELIILIFRDEQHFMIVKKLMIRNLKSLYKLFS
jgi:hypothetical protein